MRCGRPERPRGALAILGGVCHEPVELVRSALDQRAHLVGRLAEAAGTCAEETTSGSVESGRPDPDPDAAKFAATQAALERLEAVVAGEASAQAGLDAAERQVDLVVDGNHVVEINPERPARRAHRAPRLVHVGLRQQHRHARPAGPWRAVRVGRP